MDFAWIPSNESRHHPFLPHSLATPVDAQAFKLAFAFTMSPMPRAFTHREFDVTLGGEELSGVCGHYHADH
jgi:hypothetical protein